MLIKAKHVKNLYQHIIATATSTNSLQIPTNSRRQNNFIVEMN